MRLNMCKRGLSCPSDNLKQGTGRGTVSPLLWGGETPPPYPYFVGQSVPKTLCPGSIHGTIWTKSISFYMNNILLHILLLYYYSINHDFALVCIHQRYLAATVKPGALLRTGLLYIVKKILKIQIEHSRLQCECSLNKVQHSKLPPPQKYKQTLTLCPCRFTIQTAVLPRGGRGSDSSPDASRSEERYCSLMGDGNEESESPSLCVFVSFCILSICLVASFWETGSWRGGGELEIVLAPEKLLCSGSVPFDPPPCLKFPWFRRRFFPFMSCLVRQNSGQRWYFWGCSGFMTYFRVLAG